MNTVQSQSNSRDRWDFDRYLNDIIHLSEIEEIPGIKEARKALISEMWDKFPNDCKALGLRDRA